MNYLPVSCMPPLVILHITLRSEAQSTIVGAGEGPLSSMDSSVNFEVLPFIEDSTAPRDGTAVGLCSIMQVHMGLKPDLSRELFVAAWMPAGKRLVEASFASLHA